MIVKVEGLEATTMEKPRGGKGSALRLAYEAATGFKGEVTNFAMMSLEPNSSIGMHQHVGDMEIYLMLDGKAKTIDNGQEFELVSGDMMITKDGEEHCLVNDGSTPVTFLAVIIKH
jgi:quercetin dioxygenase-like cupin family protein